MYGIEINGKGEPLLMLHGWGQSHEILIPLAELMTDFTTPLLVDLPGFGKSPPPEKVWSAYDYADHLVHHLEQRGIQKFSLLGHSFGGKVSLCLALRYPEKVNRLVLIAPSGILPKRTLLKSLKIRSRAWMGKALKKFDQIAGSTYFLQSFVPKFGSKDYINAGPMRPILVKSVNEDLSEVIPQIKTKTLILWGEKDTETPLEIGVRLSELIRGAKFHSFSYHDHQIFHDVGAHLCATYIRPFILDRS